MQIVTPFVSARHVPARNTPTATKRKTNSQHPRHSDTGNKSSLFRVARRCAGQWGLVGHGDRALVGAEDRVAGAGSGLHGPAGEPEAGPLLLRLLRVGGDGDRGERVDGDVRVSAGSQSLPSASMVSSGFAENQMRLAASP